MTIEQFEKDVRSLVPSDVDTIVSIDSQFDGGKHYRTAYQATFFCGGQTCLSACFFGPTPDSVSIQVVQFLDMLDHMWSARVS